MTENNPVNVTETLTEAHGTLIRASSLLMAFELASLPVGTVKRNGSVIWDDASLQEVFAIARELVDKGGTGVSSALDELEK